MPAVAFMKLACLRDRRAQTGGGAFCIGYCGPAKNPDTPHRFRFFVFDLPRSRHSSSRTGFLAAQFSAKSLKNW
jgi:phosphatidylethanolamine-binding protein (PEBP) family uncharacterized protein